MKILFISLIVFSFGFTPKTFSPGQLNTTYAGVPEIDSTSVLDEVVAINSDAALALTSSFRQGVVSTYAFENYLTFTDYGYKIKLPAANNVATPTWHDGHLFVSGGFGSKEFFSFVAETGELNWAVTLDDDGPSSCVIDDGVAVFNTESCTIFACDINTGKHLWSYWLGDPLMSTPTIDNGIVFSSYPCASPQIFNNDQNNQSVASQVNTNLTGNYSHAIIAFELKTGKILWQKRIEGDILSAPVADNGSIHFVTFAGVYYVMNELTGEFTSAKRCRATSAPVITDGRIYFSQRADASGEAVSEIITGYNAELNSIEFRSEKKDAPYLDKEVQRSSKLKSESSTSDAGNGFGNGAPESANWRSAYDNIGQSNVSSLQNFYGSRVLTNNGSQFNMMGDTLFCMNSISGITEWKYAVAGDLHNEGGYLATSPIMAGEYIIVATLNGDILVMNKHDGKIVTKYEIKDAVRSQPIAMNGWIYITSTSGNLYAINTKDPSITGWPMLGADNKHSNNIL